MTEIDDGSRPLNRAIPTNESQTSGQQGARVFAALYFTC